MIQTMTICLSIYLSICLSETRLDRVYCNDDTLKKYLTVLQILILCSEINIYFKSYNKCLFYNKRRKKGVVYYCYGELSKQFTVVTTVARNIDTILVFQFVGGSDPRLLKYVMK